MELHFGTCNLCKLETKLIKCRGNSLWNNLIRSTFYPNTTRATKYLSNFRLCTICAYQLENLSDFKNKLDLQIPKKLKVQPDQCGLCRETNFKLIFVRDNPNNLQANWHRFHRFYNIHYSLKRRKVCFQCVFALYTWNELESIIQLELSISKSTDANEPDDASKPSAHHHSKRFLRKFRPVSKISPIHAQFADKSDFKMMHCIPYVQICSTDISRFQRRIQASPKPHMDGKRRSNDVIDVSSSEEFVQTNNVKRRPKFRRTWLTKQKKGRRQSGTRRTPVGSRKRTAKAKTRRRSSPVKVGKRLPAARSSRASAKARMANRKKGSSARNGRAVARAKGKMDPEKKVVSGAVRTRHSYKDHRERVERGISEESSLDEYLEDSNISIELGDPADLDELLQDNGLFKSARKQRRRGLQNGHSGTESMDTTFVITAEETSSDTLIDVVTYVSEESSLDTPGPSTPRLRRRANGTKRKYREILDSSLSSSNGDPFTQLIRENNIVSHNSKRQNKMRIFDDILPDSPYTCNICDQVYERLFELKSHMFWHLNPVTLMVRVERISPKAPETTSDSAEESAPERRSTETTHKLSLSTPCSPGTVDLVSRYLGDGKTKVFTKEDHSEEGIIEPENTSEQTEEPEQQPQQTKDYNEPAEESNESPVQCGISTASGNRDETVTTDSDEATQRIEETTLNSEELTQRIEVTTPNSDELTQRIEFATPNSEELTQGIEETTQHSAEQTENSADQSETSAEPTQDSEALTQKIPQSYSDFPSADSVPLNEGLANDEDMEKTENPKGTASDTKDLNDSGEFIIEDLVDNVAEVVIWESCNTLEVPLHPSSETLEVHEEVADAETMDPTRVTEIKKLMAVLLDDDTSRESFLDRTNGNKRKRATDSPTCDVEAKRMRVMGSEDESACENNRLDAI